MNIGDYIVVLGAGNPGNQNYYKSYDVLKFFCFMNCYHGLIYGSYESWRV